VPYGHYTHQMTFAEAGRYALYVDINDYSYSGEMLTFTFLINVAGTFDYLYIAAASAAAVVIVLVTMLTFMKKNKNKKKQAGRTELR
jgi:hypothetical protein